MERGARGAVTPAIPCRLTVSTGTLNHPYSGNDLRYSPLSRQKTELFKVDSAVHRLSCQLFVDCFRRSVIQRLMQSFTVVKPEISSQPADRLRDVLIMAIAFDV